MYCPYCGGKAEWVENKVIYGRNYGKSYMCYYCKPCDAYVGCHKNSRKALGTMANKELRGWRSEAHKSHLYSYETLQGYRSWISRILYAKRYVENAAGWYAIYYDIVRRFYADVKSH